MSWLTLRRHGSTGTLMWSHLELKTPASRSMSVKNFLCDRSDACNCSHLSSSWLLVDDAQVCLS